jgi:hypothetical protein
MTRQDVLNVVRQFDPEQERQWMFDLGAFLTISARGAYVLDGAGGDILQLMGFNELQHQIYGRMREFRADGAWTLESFLDGLIEKSKYYRIDGDLGWAIRRSLDIKQD